ncbi:hypothetical protein [Serratia microhaemolytica]|uniref:hypothetical protein n=1 Tax=Serratia microhaemolytica TaxID=2675110 RepID=UPI000FDF0852|nr:hypothetical protein [Serratia microhaemolytica]
MPPVKYLLSFTSYNSVCFTYVNGLTAFDNFDMKGPISAGMNITPYLQNGKNSLSIEVIGLAALQGDEDYPADAKCELRITAATPQDEQEITKLVTTANDKLRPTGLTSPDYHGQQGQLPVREGIKAESMLYLITRDITINGIPEWAWTKAEPFQPTAENMAKLQQAYLVLQRLMLNHDAAGIQQMAHFSFSEKEAAEGLPAGSWYESLFEERLPKIASASPIHWEEYELISTNNGRLVKLDKSGKSPLRLVDKEGKYVSGYAPYFSLINGKIVLTR